MTRIFPAVFLLCMISSGWAEEKIKVEEVVVTAAKIEEAAEETTSEVAVIKGEEIKKMNVTFLPDVLRRVPDLNLVQNGGDGKFSSVFLRGGDPKDTLVMIDGVKVNSNTTGTFDFSSIPVEDIERIEIVKGAQSTIYGSEAMAGVINIITKKGEGKLKMDAAFEGGSFGTYNPAVTVSGSAKSLNYRVTALYFHTDGISAAKDGTERDGYNNASLSWKFGHKPLENLELELSGYYSNDRTKLDDIDFTTGRPVDSLGFVQNGNHFLLSARGKLYLLDKWEQILTLSTFSDILKFRDPDSLFNNADILNTRQIADWQHNVYVSNAVTLTGGFEYRKEKGENRGNFDDSVENKAVYFNSKLKFLRDALIINAGLRYDDHETAGTKTTCKVGAAYNFREAGLTLRTSYGTGFRAPSLNDLFYPFYGNPALKPEESKSYEAGVVKTLFEEKMSLSLTYFKQNYKNLIQADPLTFTAANIARASVEGVEAAASLRLNDAVDIKTGYMYLNTEDKDTGKNLIKRPKNKFTAGIGYSVRNLSLLADYLYVGKRLDSSVGNELPAYSVVNLSGNYRVTKNITLFGRIENLFNAHYEEVGGFNTKGASVYGGMKVSL
ncbi:MAG: TonB-dependent receptor [Nitrospirae bacterium]|nr:TonB-dependent receptor [Nitrospirota bacterium]MCL5422609.1 TonB-dependent receptor [Nitrospirota bacterium]